MIKLFTGAAVVLLSLAVLVSSVFAQGTAFTYQGQLQNNGSPANGSYDLTFTLFPTNVTGTASAGPVTNLATVVSGGLFTVTIDFGGAFNGANYWLGLGVRTNGGTSFATLTPRQPIKPAPYAVFANTASNLSGTLAAGQLTGTIPTAVLPGFQGAYQTVGGGQGNSAGAEATVGGGQNNTANNTYATVGGGYDNAAGYLATVPGGAYNVASGSYSLAAGQSAQAIYAGDFVWADSQGSAFTATATNQFLIRASGGVGINTNNPTTALTVNGTVSANNFSGNGASLTSLNASQLSGTVANGNLPANPTFSGTVTATSFVGSGAGLTGIPTANPAQVALLKWGFNTVGNTFGVAGSPTAMCFDGSSIWVANYYSGSVTKLSASSGATIGNYNVGSAQSGICYDGANIWVTSFGENNVSKLSASTGVVLGTYSAGTNPAAICFDGANVWIGNYTSGTVTKLSASTGAIMGTYAVGSGPLGVCFDGANVWVANGNTNSVTKLAASSGGLIGTYSAGASPTAICFDGSSIWVANVSGKVTKLNAATGANIGTYTAGSGPEAICFDGANIWVVNQGANNVMRINAGTGTVLGTYATGPTPSSICFDGANIWVGNYGTTNVTKL